MAETLVVHPGRLHYYVREIFKRLRVPPEDASKTAEVLVAADLAGIESQGVAQLPSYVERLSSRLVNPTPRIRAVSETFSADTRHRTQRRRTGKGQPVVCHTASAATLDGDNGLGPVVAARAMELAMEKAEVAGAAAVAVRNSNHFGIAGYYARMALSKRMIGVALSNTSPAVVPVFGAQSMYGTNPVAIAVPTAEGSPFVLDMSTSVVSEGKIELARRKGERIPEGWALDSSGRPTTDPAVALQALRFLPLGGRFETGAHKGYGLGLAVDILCGVLSGGSFGLQVSGARGKRPGVAKISHLFVALKIDAFGPFPDFRNRIDEMLKKLTGSAPPGAPRIFYPGEPEYEMEQERRSQGIPLPRDVASELERIGRSLDLQEAWEHLLAARQSSRGG